MAVESQRVWNLGRNHGLPSSNGSCTRRPVEDGPNDVHIQERWVRLIFVEVRELPRSSAVVSNAGKESVHVVTYSRLGNQHAVTCRIEFQGAETNVIG